MADQITHGMSVVEVREIARQLSIQAAAVADIRKTIDAKVVLLERVWKGPNVTRFVHNWMNSVRASLSLLIDDLEIAAKVAKENADVQAQTSGTLDGGGALDGRLAISDGGYAPQSDNKEWVRSLPQVVESRADSLKRANPHYDDPSQVLWTLFRGIGLPGGYRNNCGYAVVAYDMRRRGYAVTARPDVDGAIMSVIARAYVDAESGEAREFRATKTKEGTSSLMRGFGPGARAVVVVEWKGGTGAHYFLAENVDGRVRFANPQNPSVNAEDFFDLAEPGAVEILRVDDQDPSALHMKYGMVYADVK